MKLLLTIALAFPFTAPANSQYFEGKVVYQNSYKSKRPNVTDAQFTSVMGSKQDYFIKGGNYKSVSNGTVSIWQIYINKDNKLYNKYTDSETIFWIDGGTKDEVILDIAHNRNVTDVLGYKCDELILKSKSQTEKYYFNSKFGVDIALYPKHLFGNWYEYLKVAKALPLKMIIDNPEFTMTSIAIEVKPMRLDDKEFQLPPNAKTAKSPN